MNDKEWARNERRLTRMLGVGHGYLTSSRHSITTQHEVGKFIGGGTMELNPKKPLVPGCTCLARASLVAGTSFVHDLANYI